MLVSSSESRAQEVSGFADLIQGWVAFGFCDASPVSSDPLNDFSLSIEVHDWLVLILKVG